MAAWMIGTALVLAGCATDNPPPVAQTPTGIAIEAPTADTLAWSDQLVTDALTAEKAARDAGKDDKAVFEAVQSAVMANVQPLADKGVSHAQLLAGLLAAKDNPRNSPLTAAVFGQMTEVASQGAPGGGHCRGCKG
jgi:hypothetical protein